LKKQPFEVASAFWGKPSVESSDRSIRSRIHGKFRTIFSCLFWIPFWRDGQRLWWRRTRPFLPWIIATSIVLLAIAVTDPFTKAIDQLGAVDASGRSKLQTRLGAIYRLERIARDSEKDHWPVMELLTTYVRENSPVTDRGNAQESGVAKKPRPRTDIQAILTVLGRRERRYERIGQVIDLHGANLRGANLLTQQQINSALGNKKTRLGENFSPPTNWGK
jgi:hypothetical protein